MKFKEYHFDVEIIIDYNYMKVVGKPCNISTHRVIRDLTLDQVVSLIKSNQMPQQSYIHITFNIRGVNY